jgi:hypothetical protein
MDSFSKKNISVLDEGTTQKIQKTPSQGHATSPINQRFQFPVHHENRHIRQMTSPKKTFLKSYSKFIAIFFLSGLQGLSIMLGETNDKNCFNEFKLISIMIGIMLLLALFYAMTKSAKAKNGYSECTKGQKDYVAFLLCALGGFIFSYEVMQFVHIHPIFNHKIPSYLASKTLTLLHTNYFNLNKALLILASACFFISICIYSLHRSRSNLYGQTDVCFDDICNLFLRTFILSILLISINYIVYGIANSLAKGWYDIKLSLITSAFWVGILFIFFWNNRQNNKRQYNSLHHKKGLPYYSIVMITWIILPALIAMTIINQSGYYALTIHDTISSTLVPLFLALLAVTIMRILPLDETPLYSIRADDSDQNRQTPDNSLIVVTSEESTVHDDEIAITPFNNTPTH